MSNPGPQDQTVAAALGRSEPLTGLLQRMQASKARLEALVPLFPPGLADGVRAGPLDDGAWILLVSHAAAAAKLRQMLPALEAALRDHGWPGPPIKIKVLPRA
jgi:Dna[CI] antecedent, DciA